MDHDQTVHIPQAAAHVPEEGGSQLEKVGPLQNIVIKYGFPSLSSQHYHIDQWFPTFSSRHTPGGLLSAHHTPGYEKCVCVGGGIFFLVLIAERENFRRTVSARRAEGSGGAPPEKLEK